MIVRREKTYTLNLGNYESAKITGVIQIDTEQDTEWAHFTSDEIALRITERIDSWLAHDVEKLGNINAPLKDGQSAIDFWEEMDG